MSGCSKPWKLKDQISCGVDSHETSGGLLARLPVKAAATGRSNQINDRSSSACGREQNPVYSLTNQTKGLCVCTDPLFFILHAKKSLPRRRETFSYEALCLFNRDSDLTGMIAALEIEQVHSFCQHTQVEFYG